jgi:hypothetical protein
VWITTPYFIPDDAIMTALQVAAAGGLDVRVIVPAKGDSRLVDLAARSYFAELLAAGVKLYEYQPRFIHAKTMVIDDDLAIVGTANLDNRSFSSTSSWPRWSTARSWLRPWPAPSSPIRRRRARWSRPRWPASRSSPGSARPGLGCSRRSCDRARGRAARAARADVR